MDRKPKTTKRAPSQYVKRIRLGKSINFRVTQAEELEMDEILKEMQRDDPTVKASDLYRAAMTFYREALKDERNAQGTVQIEKGGKRK